ncbi:MAG: hypothetical protein ACHQAR_04015, partial [Steroidobacterales bacterium]
MPSLTVADRFCGPPDSANGGYFAGLLAQHSTQPLRIRLERPIPLNIALEIERAAMGCGSSPAKLPRAAWWRRPGFRTFRWPAMAATAPGPAKCGR